MGTLSWHRYSDVICFMKKYSDITSMIAFLTTVYSL
jgi:hypothetical protein